MEFWEAVNYALWLYLVLVYARVVLEITRVFARTWRPAGASAVVFEGVYLTTDPPLRAIRKVIRPIRLGTVSLDLSVMILLVAILILRLIVGRLG